MSLPLQWSGQQLAPGLGQSTAPSAASSGAGLVLGTFLTLPSGFSLPGSRRERAQGRDRLLCSPFAARPERSLLPYVPSDFCVELPWCSLSVSIFDLLHFCRASDSHHQDMARMAYAPLPGGEHHGVSPARACWWGGHWHDSSVGSAATLQGNLPGQR